MSLKLITAPVPTVLAVSLAEALLHLRVDSVDDDALITSLIWAATQAAEQMTGLALLPQTWELALDAFPAAFELTRVPVVSVTSIKYIDTTGAEITLSSALYTLDNASDFSAARVNPAFEAVWPDTRVQANAVKLQFLAGYASAALVPESIKAWIKLQVGAMYEQRQAEVVGNGSAIALGFADRLLDRYKIYA